MDFLNKVPYTAPPFLVGVEVARIKLRDLYTKHKLHPGTMPPSYNILQ